MEIRGSEEVREFGEVRGKGEAVVVETLQHNRTNVDSTLLAPL